MNYFFNFCFQLLFSLLFLALASGASISDDESVKEKRGIFGGTVSYTHLDVYKRQLYSIRGGNKIIHHNNTNKSQAT